MTKSKFIIIAFFTIQKSFCQCDPAAIFANDSTNAVCFEIIDNVRKCYTNDIPAHNYGPFGGGNTIEGQDFDYSMCLYPEQGETNTLLIEDPSSQGCGNGIIFGVSEQGINYSPFARLYWVNPNTMEENLDYHVEADFTLNMDLNGGHVNAVNRYHYHNIPLDYYTNDLNIGGTAHSPLLGYAADGFPIYYKYLYADAMNSGDGISAFESSYELKFGSRQGDGITAPDGAYDGNYIEDYEYIVSLSDLDECGGRFAKTPEYPNGTYYYVLTDNWPFIPRCLKGKYVDNSFRLGANCPGSTAADDCSTVSSSNVLDGTTIEVTIYPNPACDYITLALSSKFEKEKIDAIKIYSLNASILYLSNKFEEEIDISSLVSGTYFIQIDAGKAQLTKKLIVQ